MARFHEIQTAASMPFIRQQVCYFHLRHAGAAMNNHIPHHALPVANYFIVLPTITDIHKWNRTEQQSITWYLVNNVRLKPGYMRAGHHGLPDLFKILPHGNADHGQTACVKLAVKRLHRNKLVQAKPDPHNHHPGRPRVVAVALALTLYSSLFPIQAN